MSSSSSSPSSSTTRALPPSLRRMLTVTASDSAPRTTAVAPSPLLARLDAFLPQLAAANHTLPSVGSERDAFVPTHVPIHPPPEPLLTAVPPQPPRPSRQHASSTQQTPSQPLQQQADDVADNAVTMNIYIDNSQGQLVPSDEPRDSTPLIQPLSPRPQR